MKAFVDSIAGADGVVRISNTIYSKDDKSPKLKLLKPFMNAFYSDAIEGPVTRSETAVSDVLRRLADAVDQMEGDFEDWDTAHFLGQILQGAGKGLQEGIALAQNSRQCLKMKKSN